MTEPVRALSRRSFLSLAGGAVAIVGLPLMARPALAATKQGSSSTSRGTPTLVRSVFLPAMGEVFRMTGSVWSADVVLDSVDDLAGAVAPGAEDAFGLMFRADQRVPVAQGTYRISSRRTGAFDLFAVPVDFGRIARYYQVVVNRVTRPGEGGDHV